MRIVSYPVGNFCPSAFTVLFTATSSSAAAAAPAAAAAAAAAAATATAAAAAALLQWLVLECIIFFDF